MDEVERLVKRIRDNCVILAEGYYEKVEYSVPVKYHAAGCAGSLRCGCPVENEKRVRNVRRPGLLDQLRDFAANKDTDRNPKAERGAPRVKTAGRPPGDLGGFFALDELSCEIIRTVEEIIRDHGGDPTWVATRTTKEVLDSLDSLAANLDSDSTLDSLKIVDSAVARWVASARRTLRITAAESIFDSVVCGNCGGALSTPWGNRGEDDVRCVGTPDAGPCGETYPMSEWLRLYEDQKRRAA